MEDKTSVMNDKPSFKEDKTIVMDDKPSQVKAKISSSVIVFKKDPRLSMIDLDRKSIQALGQCT